MRSLKSVRTTHRKSLLSHLKSWFFLIIRLTAFIAIPYEAWSQMGFTPMMIKDQLPESCQELFVEGKSASDSGTYIIDPDSIEGPLPPMKARCDFINAGQTGEGGWTLILNYLHKGGTNPALTLKTSSLPLKGSDTLGTDESGTDYWGHTPPQLLGQLSITSMRWYCQTSAHSRKHHFITADLNAIAYAKTGLGANMMSQVENSATQMPDHSAIWQDNRWGSNKGDYALTDFPFYRGATYHWGIKGNNNRWECDDYPRSSNNHTLHRIWVKQRYYYKSCNEMKVSKPLTSSGIYTIDVDGETGSISPFPVYCDMTGDGGGWTLIASSTTSSSGLANTVESLTSTSVAGILAQQKIVALAQLSANVRIDGDGKKVISQSTQPINRLRLFKSISQTNVDTASVNWTGDIQYLNKTCQIDHGSLTGAIYHACGNGGGLHWIGTVHYKWDYNISSQNNLNLWVK